MDPKTANREALRCLAVDLHRARIDGQVESYMEQLQELTMRCLELHDVRESNLVYIFAQLGGLHRFVYRRRRVGDALTRKHIDLLMRYLVLIPVEEGRVSSLMTLSLSSAVGSSSAMFVQVLRHHRGICLLAIPRDFSDASDFDDVVVQLIDNNNYLRYERTDMRSRLSNMTIECGYTPILDALADIVPHWFITGSVPTRDLVPLARFLDTVCSSGNLHMSTSVRADDPQVAMLANAAHSVYALELPEPMRSFEYGPPRMVQKTVAMARRMKAEAEGS